MTDPNQIAQEAADDHRRTFIAAMKRMERARDRGTGCHLTAEMVWAISGISSWCEDYETVSA